MITDFETKINFIFAPDFIVKKIICLLLTLLLKNSYCYTRAKSKKILTVAIANLFFNDVRQISNTKWFFSEWIIIV
jgi:hypothetical protein